MPFSVIWGMFDFNTATAASDMVTNLLFRRITSVIGDTWCRS